MIYTEDQKARYIVVLNKVLKNQKDTKKYILNLMQSLVESVNPLNTNSADEIKKISEDLISSLELCNKNINIIENLIQSINCTSNIPNAAFTKRNTNSPITVQSECSTDNPHVNSKPKIDLLVDVKKLKSSGISKQSVNKDSKGKEYEENTLVISETSKKVILPYDLSILKKKLENSNNNYSSIDEIIKKEYTLPISKYKNPFISRFKEGYNLMRKKERSSMIEALQLGFELMFNYNLHPAIISACRNLDELDIYLDYLDSGEINKFKCFNILFKIPPTVGKAKHQL